MVVLTRFVLEQQTSIENSFIASTVVSTPLMEKMAAAFGVECKLGLTGFKWIGKMIQDTPTKNFLCGGEESYGFLVGDKVRDKDAISAALHIKANALRGAAFSLKRTNLHSEDIVAHRNSIKRRLSCRL